MAGCRSGCGIVAIDLGAATQNTGSLQTIVNARKHRDRSTNMTGLQLTAQLDAMEEADEMAMTAAIIPGHRYYRLAWESAESRKYCGDFYWENGGGHNIYACSGNRYSVTPALIRGLADDTRLHC